MCTMVVSLYYIRSSRLSGLPEPKVLLRLFLVRTIHDWDGHAVNTFEDQAHDSSLEPAFPPEIDGAYLLCYSSSR